MNKKIKILYLADNAADVHLVEQVLRKSKYNFTIKPVNNKIDFTNSLKNEPCDLIFADSNLAGFKGMQALNHSKKLKPKIPFILITDVLDDKTLVNFIDEGVWDYVFKDKLLRLISTVANALKIKKKEESLISALVKIVEIMKEYRFLHENVTDMLLSYDDSTKRILKCNKTFLKTTGYSEAEIYNTLFSKLIPRLEFQTTLVGYFKTLKKSGISDDYSTRLIKKDNTKMYCSLMSKVNEDNTVDVVLRDYSHTKKHENERLKFLEVFDKGIYEKYIINSYSLKMEYANKTALAKLGYSFSEIKNITFADIQPEYSVSEIFDIVQKLEENEELPLKYFTTQKSKSGETYPVEVVLQKTKRGGYNIILAFVTDITNTIYNEKIMTQLETVAAQSPVSIVITDKEGAIEYINPAFSKITGYSFEDVVGKNPNILQSGTHTAEYYKEMWDTVLRGEVWKGQFRNKKKTGEIFWEESAISAIKNKSGDITGIVAVKNDITKRKRINEKLRRSEAHYRQYFENSVLGLYVSDMDGVLIRANESLYTLLGYQTLEEMRESSYLNTNQYNFYRREFMAELLKNGTVSSYEWVWLDKSGKQIFLRENAGIFLNAEGQKIIEGSVENITEQKKAKAAIVELNELNQNFIKFGELGYAVFSLKGECKYANENYAKIVNQSLSEIKKTNLSHSIFWKENEMQKHLNDIITNGQAIKKAIEVKRNDKTLWIDMVIKRLKYKGKLRLVVVIKDISFAIQANRKQLELKADFNRLTEYITMPVFGIKKNGKISQWNEIMAVISGKSKEDSIGKQAKDVFPENEFDQIIEEMFEMQDVPYFNTELVLNVNTNKVYSEKLLVTIMPFRKEGEQLTELIAFGQDITKREKYKCQLEKEVELR
ncbi:MAG: PAS domain S-box protein, partial [Bacteroidota bacterium]|nr:PAS domain S-box protein [Bacteroidota bacterium]